jgi:hypothetical protein
MFKSNKKYINQLFAMMPTIDRSGQGIALIVLKETAKKVVGLKFVVNDHDYFELSVKDFEKLIEGKKIAFVENTPTDIIDALMPIFNLKKK